jgi:hypothetical protein
MRIRKIARARVRYGYRKIRVLLKRGGWYVGEYRVYRLDLWAHRDGVKVNSSKPSKPTNNACVESFNGTFGARRLSFTGSLA